MINLLPIGEKQKLLSSNKEKLAVIWGIVSLIGLVCLTLILLSVKFYILAEADYQKNILNQTYQKVGTSEFESLSNVIQKYNGILVQLNSFYEKETYLSHVFKIITGIKNPSDLYLTSISLNRDSVGIVSVSVSGVSDTRDSLLVFKNNVEQNKEVKNPFFSPESWVSPKDISFSLKFEIGENEK